MKIYDKLLQLIKENGTPQKAWFTSFNLSPSFAENYLIPALLGIAKPTRWEHYEEINQEIIRSGIDLKFFSDHRAFKFDTPVRTNVEYYPIKPENFGNKFKDGVFHPKVCLLKFKDKSFLITGSANISVGGWAHNRECVFFNEIKSQANINKINDFFRLIFESCILKWQAIPTNNFKNTDEGWQFISAFDEQLFLDQLLPSQTKELYIWSPYFSNRLKLLIDKHILPKCDTLYIIPDKMGNGKMRISQDDQTIFRNENIRLHTDNLNFKSEDFLNHSKLWLSDNNIGIGSWNMTNSALGLNTADGNNIEAGVICNISSSQRKHFIDNLTNIDFNPDLFLTNEESEAEALNLPDGISFTIKVIYDWKERYYSFEISNDQNESLKNFEILVPGKKDKIKVVKLDSPIDCQPTKLYKEHTFKIYNEDIIVYQGLIIEKNKQFRPSGRFDSFSDLVEALKFKNEGSAHEDEALRARANTINHGELDEYGTDELIESRSISNISYFDWFMVSKNLRDEISQLKSDEESLIKILKVRPGNIEEIIDKASDIPNEQTIFKWIIFTELNTILSFFPNSLTPLTIDYTKTTEDIIGKLETNILKKGNANKKWFKEVKKEMINQF